MAACSGPRLFYQPQKKTAALLSPASPVAEFTRSNDCNSVCNSVTDSKTVFLKAHLRWLKHKETSLREACHLVALLRYCRLKLSLFSVFQFFILCPVFLEAAR